MKTILIKFQALLLQNAFQGRVLETTPSLQKKTYILASGKDWVSMKAEGKTVPVQNSIAQSTQNYIYKKYGTTTVHQRSYSAYVCSTVIIRFYRKELTLKYNKGLKVV